MVCLGAQSTISSSCELLVKPRESTSHWLSAGLNSPMLSAAFTMNSSIFPCHTTTPHRWWSTLSPTCTNISQVWYLSTLGQPIPSISRLVYTRGTHFWYWYSTLWSTPWSTPSQRDTLTWGTPYALLRARLTYSSMPVISPSLLMAHPPAGLYLLPQRLG